MLTTLIYAFLSYHSWDSNRIYQILISGSQGELLFRRALGYVSPDAKDRFDVRVVESRHGYDLILAIDGSSSTYWQAIFLKYPDNSVKPVMMHPNYLDPYRHRWDSLEWRNHVSHLVDRDVFNDYIRAFGFRRDEVIEHFMRFVTVLDGRALYRILRTHEDVVSMLKDFPPYREDCSDSPRFDIPETTGDSKETTNAIVLYAWLFNKGVVRFSFEFNSDSATLHQVVSKIVAYYGNETISFGLCAE